MLRALVLMTLCLSAGSAFAAADTLVVRAQDGSFLPGAAVSWKEEGGSVRFTLADGVDSAAVVQALSERIAGAQFKAEPKAVVVNGVPLTRLLEQLATVSVTGGDPLAGIAGMQGTAVAFAAPEAGGSIRATKPQLLAALVPHEPTERLEAEVIEVQRGAFPAVALKLHVRRAPKAGPYAKQLASNKVFVAVVAFTGKQQTVDMTSEPNQRNAGAYYVQPRDRVFVHVNQLDPKGAASVDWIERAQR
jgi:hypothetical protein